MDSIPLVIDNVEVCRDAPEVRDAAIAAVRLALERGARLEIAMARARTPSSGRAGAPAITARAKLFIGDDAPEEREFTTPSRACASLVRALGAGVTVRMDDWSARAKAAPVTSAATVAPVTPAPVDPAAATRAWERLPVTSGLDTQFDVDREGRRLPEPRGPELGAAAFLASGVARSTAIGASATVTLPLAETFVARAGLFGGSAAATDETIVGHQLGMCRRFPGRYARWSGLALDLCAAGEVGLVSRAVYAGFGPTAALHGDLSRSLSLDLSGSAVVPFGEGVTAAHEPGAVMVAARGDVGLSWRLP